MASTASTPLEEIDGNTGKTVAADLDRKGVTDCIPLSENVQEPVKGEKGVKETVSKEAVVKKTDLATPVTPGVTDLPIAAGLRVGAREGGRGEGGRGKGEEEGTQEQQGGQSASPVRLPFCLLYIDPDFS